MANLFIILLLISAFLLIIAETVKVKITYQDELIINIDYLLFTLTLYPNRSIVNGRKGRTKSFVERLKIGFRRSRAARRALEFLFSHSRIILHEINIPLEDRSPSRFVLTSQNILALISMLMAYLSLKSETLVSDDNVLISTEKELIKKLPTVDLTLKTRLWVTAFSIIIFGYESARKRGGRRSRNVRNKNERYYKNVP